MIDNEIINRMDVLCKTEWFSLKNNPPNEEGACLIVYYEEGPLCHITTSLAYSNGTVFDEDYEEVQIKDNMIWSYYPNPAIG